MNTHLTRQPVQPKVSKWNAPPDGKTRVSFDIEDSLHERLRTIADAQEYPSMTAFYVATLAAAAAVMEERLAQAEAKARVDGIKVI